VNTPPTKFQGKQRVIVIIIRILLHERCDTTGTQVADRLTERERREPARWRWDGREGSPRREGEVGVARGPLGRGRWVGGWKSVGALDRAPTMDARGREQAFVTRGTEKREARAWRGTIGGPLFCRDSPPEKVTGKWSYIRWRDDRCCEGKRARIGVRRVLRTCSWIIFKVESRYIEEFRTRVCLEITMWQQIIIKREINKYIIQN